MKARDVIWVDGTPYAAPSHGIRLVDWLRETADCRSVKEGCGAGQCGACTVLAGDVPVLACCVLAISFRGREIRTARGLARTKAGASLLQNLTKYGGVQCGFCTPGMLVACYAWLTGLDRQSAGEGTGGDGGASLRNALAGNICRCTGYAQIMQSARATAAETTAASAQVRRGTRAHDEP